MTRRVCDRGDEVLRDEFRLGGWVLKPKARRNFYFAWCRHSEGELLRLTGGAPPGDKALLWTLVGALGEDESFAAFIRKHGDGGSFLIENANWDKVYRAAAATILEEYLDAVEARRWP